MAKGMMIIDGQRVSFDGEKNVLSVDPQGRHRNADPLLLLRTFPFIGACRMCVVENERDRSMIDASCSMEPRDGMAHPHEHRAAFEAPPRHPRAAARLP